MGPNEEKILEAPLVSVIIPAKNRSELIRETLDSVAAQTFERWEVIVVDDGSDDGTVEVVQDYANKDKRIHCRKRLGEISGANACRNEGARLAASDLLIFLDSDDRLNPECLENRVGWMNRNPDLDFIVCHAMAFIKSPNDLSRPASYFSHDGDLERFLYFDLPWLITGPTWRKTAFIKLDGFNEEIPSWQDVELHVRAILNGLRYLNLPVSDYQVRWQNDPSKTSLIQRRSDDHLNIGEQTVKSFYNLLASTDNLTWTRLRGIASLFFMLAEFWIDQGKFINGLSVWHRAQILCRIEWSAYFSGFFFSS